MPLSTTESDIQNVFNKPSLINPTLHIHNRDQIDTLVGQAEMG